MPLTALGTASYNGYTFSSYAETVRMSASYRYDDANRTIIYSEWTIAIKDKVFVTGTSVDDQMDAIYAKLSVPGGQFIYTSHGAGAFSINVNGKNDVRWGPKPQGMDTRMMGRDQAREFIWTVVVCVPQSCVSPVYGGAIMAFNYTVDFSIDLLGYTTRNMTGYIEIPMTRTSATSRQIPDDADSYLENFLPSLPVQFRRTNRGHRVSPDRSRIDFSYTDEQMVDQMYQQGVAIADITESVRNEQPANFYRWNSTISGSYTMAYGIPRQLAFQRFAELVANRLEKGFTFAKVTPTSAVNANASKKVDTTEGLILPLNFSMSVSEHDKSAGSFSFTYRILTDLGNLIQATGAWTPLPGTSYNQWLSSVKGLDAGSMMGQRGSAQLRHLPSDDVIVDLCVQPRAQLSSLSKLVKGPTNYTSMLRGGVPPPLGSYLDASLRLQVVADTNISVMKSMPVNVNSNSLTGGPRPSMNAKGRGLSSQSDRVSKLPNQTTITGMAANVQVDIVQQRTEPTIKFRLYGFIERVYYPVECPLLVSVGGQPVILLKNSFTVETIGNAGLPIFRGDFDQIYALPTGNFSAMPIPRDPADFTPTYDNNSGWVVSTDIGLM